MSLAYPQIVVLLEGHRTDGIYSIGQGFAQSELKCLLAAFVGKWQFELSREGGEYFPAGLVTTKPQGGMWLRMKRVEGW